MSHIPLSSHPAKMEEPSKAGGSARPQAAKGLIVNPFLYTAPAWNAAPRGCPQGALQTLWLLCTQANSTSIKFQKLKKKMTVSVPHDSTMVSSFQDSNPLPHQILLTNTQPRGPNMASNHNSLLDT